MRSLQARMFLVFALIATLPLVAMSYLALRETRAALAEEAGLSREDSALVAAGYVETYVDRARLALDAASRRPPPADADEARLRLLALAAEASQGGPPVYRALAILDADGAVLARLPDGANVTLPLEEARALARNATGAVLLPVPPDGTALPLVAPMGDLTLVADVDLGALAARLQALRSGAGGKGILLVDAEGRLLAHPSPELAGSRADLSTLPPVQAARTTRSGAVEYEDATTGTAILAGYALVPRLGWVVVEGVPAAEAYAPLARLTALLVVLSGILVGAVLLASVVVARRIVQPVRDLTAAAKDFSAGHLSSRIDAGGDDEIGALGRAFNEMADRIGESLEGLRRSEARYRGLVESANDMIFTIQPGGELSFVSPLSERLLGWRPPEVVGGPAETLVHEADRAAFLEAVHHVLRAGEPVLWIPYRMRTREGGTRSVVANFSPIFDGSATPARVLGVAHDVTVERRQQLVRDKAFEMARLVSEEADLDLLTARGLALMLSLVAFPRGAAYIQLVGGDLREVATAGPEGIASRLTPLARRAIEAHAPVVEDATVGVPLLERGEAVGAVVLEADMGTASEEDVEVLRALASQLAVGIRRSLFEARLKDYAARLESRVEDRTRELRDKSAEMESFLYSVSHDLKAPLISIEGYAQSLQEDYGHVLEGDGVNYLDRIRKNAGLMESLILDILELSRIGRVRGEVVDVDVEGVVRGIAARLADRYHQAGATLEVAPGLPRAFGERKRLEQLFTNLLDNALKYRHPDRPLRVEVTGEVVGELSIFHVRDTGRGIPAHAHATLFSMFQRVPMPGLPDPGGTGMGLAIVKRIVDTHGGALAFESDEAWGTVFHVRLPRSRPASPPPPPDLLLESARRQEEG